MTGRPAARAGLRSVRRSVRRAVLAVVVALAAMLVLPAVGLAAGSGERITSFRADYVLDAQGGMSVTETITYQFPEGEQRHGILRAIVVRQGIDATGSSAATTEGIDTASNPTGQYREYTLSDVSATSPSGAPAGIASIDSVGAADVIRIGDPNRTTSGTQTYVLKYHLADVLNAFSDHNELYYNVFGTDDTIPKDSATVTVTGPGGVTKVACYLGRAGSTTTCPATAGATATFSPGSVPAGSALTIVASLPTAGYGTITPQIRTDTSPGSAGYDGFGGPTMSTGTARLLSNGALGVAFLAPLAALAGMILLVRSRGRDEVYADVTPGLAPAGGSQTGQVRRGKLGPVAVQFTPPKGVQPGMVGTIIDETANTIDVSATVIDLAVRGFLRIEEVAPTHLFARTDWVLSRQAAPAEENLLPYEEALLAGLFATGDTVALSDLRNHFSQTLQRVEGLMYDEVVHRGWFRRSPQSQRVGWLALGIAVAVLGIGAGFLASGPLTQAASVAGSALPVPFVLIGGLVVAGLIIVIASRFMAWRTADGSAVLAQSRGFKEYLVTAEAQQIAFEEAQQIFSRYLPYAVVFGVADRWATVFGQVAEAATAAGQPLVMPTWYLWNGAAFPNFAGIANGVQSFSTTASGTFTSTPGSSGSSGFGGGGFSGGGVGGSSSGSW